MRSTAVSLTLTRVHFALGAIALAGITACSSSASPALAPITSQAGSSRAHGDTKHCPSGVVYEDAPTNHSVVIYDSRHLHSRPCGAITGLGNPQGLFVDSKGNLWIAVAGTNQILEFAPGSSAPSVTLSDPDGIPNAVAVDEKSGSVYVADYQNTDPTKVVEVYAAGSTTPTGSLNDPNGRNGGFVAVDNQGNVYATFMTQDNKGQIDRWPAGGGDGENLSLQMVGSGPIVTTQNGALAVCDTYSYRCGIFEPGATKMSHVFGHMGWPKHRHTGGGVNPDKAPWLMPLALAINSTESAAYVSAAPSLSQWKYPGPAHRHNHRPKVEIQVPGGEGEGIAVYPASRSGAPF